MLTRRRVTNKTRQWREPARVRSLFWRTPEMFAGIYNLLLIVYLFDRHRDMGLPTSFLIDEKETS